MIILKLKTSWHYFWILALLLSFNPVYGQENTSSDKKPYVILISFDGFRYDYVDNHNTPNFDSFIKNGAAAEKMLPSFPSKTFPNHYTIITGLYPGNHGLVDNSFYDPIREETYTTGNRNLVEDEYYYGGMPLWQLAKKNGMKSASYFWVGSETAIAGSFPDYYYKYDGSVPNEERINKVFDWLQLPEMERPRFISLYFSLTDDVGHSFGPDSREIDRTVIEIDNLLGMLMKKLKSLPLNVNVILVSDHGMYPMINEPDTYILFNKLFKTGNKSFVSINNGTHVHIYSKTGNQNQLDSIYNTFQKNIKMGFSVYKKSDIPIKWHYQNNRTGDILLVANPGKYFLMGERSSTDQSQWGTHGFDPYITPEMGAIFYANGPNIAHGVKIGAFENINVYPLIAKILGLEIPEIDGKFEVLEPIYIEKNQ